MPTPDFRRSMRFAALRLGLAVALAMPSAVAPASLSAATISTFVPIGAGYAADTLRQFAREAAEVDTSGVVSILVLPIAYGVDPLSMSNGLRNQNLTFADGRRGQIEDACLAVIRAGETCHVVLAPVLVRADAYVQANVDLVTPGLDGIFVLGGDQDVAMEVVASTPFEAALANARAATLAAPGDAVAHFAYAELQEATGDTAGAQPGARLLSPHAR